MKPRKELIEAVADYINETLSEVIEQCDEGLNSTGQEQLIEGIKKDLKGLHKDYGGYDPTPQEWLAIGRRLKQNAEEYAHVVTLTELRVLKKMFSNFNVRI